jgi:hypothetical protein
MTEQLTPGTFFRFPDESTWISAATAAGFYSEPVRARNEDGTYAADDPATPADEAWTGTLIACTHDRALDVIGLIYRGGEWNPETGEVITPPMLLDGWHVNYQGALPDGWDAYVVYPNNPARVWA